MRKSTDIISKYNQYESQRAPYVLRAEQYAKWTLQYIFPPENYNGEMSLDTNYDSVGPAAVNHLLNKIMLALFAPARPFYRLSADDKAMATLTQETGLDETGVNNLLSSAERQTMTNLAAKGMRPALFRAVALLIVTGNALLYNPKKGSKDNPRTYSLRNYVVKRNYNGTINSIIIKECITAGQLSLEQFKEYESRNPGCKDEDKIDLYLAIEEDEKDDEYFTINQYAGDVLLTNDRKTKGRVKKTECRYMPLTWKLNDGADYGTGHVEDYEGEFNFYTAMSLCLAEAGAIMSEFKFMVNPNGVADVNELQSSANGAYVWGLPDDISLPQLDKSRDLTFVAGRMDQAERRIGRAFLMNSAVTRDAERVTAEEMRMQAEELETALGGVYTNLAETAQRRLAIQELDDIDIKGLEGLEPVIITGLDALSRGSEHEQFMLLLQDTTILNNVPEDIRAELNVPAVVTRLATGRGVEYKGLLKSAENKQAEERKAMQQNAELLAQDAAAKSAVNSQE